MARGGAQCQWRVLKPGGTRETPADFDFLKFDPPTFLEGADMICVPIRIELRVKTNGRIIRDLEAHL